MLDHAAEWVTFFLRIYHFKHILRRVSNDGVAGF